MGQSKSKLSPSDLHDLVSCTEFTESEIEAWYKSFMRDCPSGTLTLEEFTGLHYELFPNVQPSAYAKRVFKTFDTNQNGMIDFREFMCALSVTSRGSFNEKLRWTFNMYDTDNDGSVCLNEMEDMIKAIYKLLGDDVVSMVLTDGLTPVQRARLMFARMDKDNDAQVNFNEFFTAAIEDPKLVMLLQPGKNKPQKDEQDKE